MPAWQNRQPRVQPRMISIGARLWTVSTCGTRNRVNGLGRTGTIRLRTVFGTPGVLGATPATVPSS